MYEHLEVNEAWWAANVSLSAVPARGLTRGEGRLFSDAEILEQRIQHVFVRDHAQQFFKREYCVLQMRRRDFRRVPFSPRVSEFR